MSQSCPPSAGRENCEQDGIRVGGRNSAVGVLVDKYIHSFILYLIELLHGEEEEYGHMFIKKKN